MSDEMRLPDELAACEARLAAFGLPSAGIDRDELLYRAGWAAAMAQASVAEKPAGANTAQLALATGDVRRTRLTTAVWSLASAALAASIAVVATLQLRSPLVVEVAATAQSPVAEASAAPAAVPATVAAEVNARSVRLAPLRPPINAGFIALRQRALTDALAEPEHTAADSDAGMAETKSARELLDEMLPAGRPRPSLGWPWRANDVGEST